MATCNQWKDTIAWPKARMLCKGIKRSHCFGNHLKQVVSFKLQETMTTSNAQHQTFFLKCLSFTNEYLLLSLYFFNPSHISLFLNLYNPDVICKTYASDE